MNQDFKVYLRRFSLFKILLGRCLICLTWFWINATREVSVAKLMKYIIDAIQNGDRENLDWFPVLIVF